MNVSTKFTIPITELEQPAFCSDDKEDLKAKTLRDEFAVGVRWQKIPKEFIKMEVGDLDRKIRDAKLKLSEKLLILGHHYQRDEVIQYADYTGDSYKLSKFAASNKSAEYIVFCGVHFMAETADILSGNDQKVILPNLTAGCSMADMAEEDDVIDCWNDLEGLLSDKGGVTPITYMNSSAAIKGLCGKNGGIVCTSSNAEDAFKWSLKSNERILFLPDQHLGRNTGLKLGFELDEMIVWNPFKPLGGNTESEIEKSKIILWKGHCSVHTRFNTDQINLARSKYSDVNVIVHPECTMEVVNSADYVGSTEYIKDMIENAPAGSTWAVGTEISLVNRINKMFPDKNIFCLDSAVCPCSTMYRIHPAYLCWVLESLLDNEIVNQISVESDVKNDSILALNRMLKL
ncbi:MAG: quinolinate synthase NadA [SAR202 cluster bacterium]|nr:quinolinate synthase NadA [SAR202 cluster bacterium]|tara:strand:+ start:46046 stop:47251 length:1206 start_codon:yes stop_codon:yes gene_type:complete